VRPELLHSVLVAYNAAVTHTWYVAVALSSLSLIGAVFIEWKSVKGKKIEMTAGAWGGVFSRCYCFLCI
jgi:hypothetical protein